MKHSLLFRLTILYAVAFTALSTVGFLIFYYRIYAVTMERLDRELLAETRKYAALMKEAGPEGVRSTIDEDAESDNPKEDFFRVLTIHGDILISTDMSSWGNVPRQDILRKMQKEGLPYVIQTLTIEGREDKARMITAIIGPDAVLQTGESLEEVQDYLAIFLKLFSLLVISLIIVSAIIGWVLARRATMDMQEVTETAEEISSGAYDRRVQIKGRLKEIERLGATFNRMLDRIQSLLRSMKETNDNLAHDLRSPLARIRGIAEMNLLKEKTLAEYKDMAASTIEECDTLIGMINTMLDIAEAEAGVNGVPPEEFDLVALIREACELFRPIAEDKKITLDTSLPESLTIVSDRKKMQRIVTNLLENALKYTPEDGSVAVSAAARDGEIRIEFEDTGMGIPESDLPHIFKRFYRCDRSRSQGGVGLGLSLVKAYTESLNGTIRVDSTLNLGSRFALRFERQPISRPSMIR
ncbi:MAG: HAMP domain-containing histidine kinase [Deltaproteobacteria bacterium]|nr:HAMP domain-containing histidine kinase [Deltaproteobacteria bacterium]MDH3382627.1 HAMP domain-containing histidine kinase [Deltaproteobacteria bacterium]